MRGVDSINVMDSRQRDGLADGAADNARAIAPTFCMPAVDHRSCSGTGEHARQRALRICSSTSLALAGMGVPGP